MLFNCAAANACQSDTAKPYSRSWPELHTASAPVMLLLLAIPALFVGNQACSGCHAEIYRSYSATPMAMSSGRNLPALTPGSFRHAASQVRYDIDAKGLVRLPRARQRDQRQLSYFIGSGVAGRSFGLPPRRISLSRRRSPGTRKPVPGMSRPAMRPIPYPAGAGRSSLPASSATPARRGGARAR